MRMHILSGGRLRMKRRIYVPDAESSELIELPVMCFLLRHEQGNVLFDTGCHPQAAVDPESRWGDLAKAMKLISPADENLITGLDAVGLQPSDIDVVVNSHFHPDHCGCNEFFKKATVVCHAKELEAATAPAGEKAGFLAKDWRHPNRFDTLDSQRDLFGDGDIVLVPVPGHTPGTTAALVTLERSGSYLLASDAVPLQDHLDREYNPRNTWNPDLSLRSIAEIKRIHASGTKVIFGHDAEQFRTLKKGPDFYE